MPNIRRAEARDAAALARLAERTVRDAFGHLNTAEDMELHCHSSYGEQRQAREIADPDVTTIVCEEGGELIAYGQLGWRKATPAVAAARPAEIVRLYVDRPWHGTGVAQRLMAALLDAARAGEADAVWLGVWEHNPRAIAFYRKLGFLEVGEHSFVLGRDTQRDIVMQKALRDQAPIAHPPSPRPR